MSKKKKKSLILAAEYFLFLWPWYLARLLPLKAAYLVSGFFGWGARTFDRRHWNRIVNHILHTGVCTDRKEAVCMAKRSVAGYCRMFVEIAKADQCFSMEKVTVKGDPETIRDLIDPKTRKYPNHIVIGAHYGNWEIAGSILTGLTGNGMCSIMRSFENPLIGRKILSHRSCPGHELADRKAGIRPLYKALLNGKNISIVADQHASRGEGVEVSFFGHPARTHFSPALLHLKTGIPICPAVTRRVPGGDFRFEEIFGRMIMFHPTGDKEADILAVTQLCNDELERLIRMDPEQWMWAARRWLDADDRSRRKKDS